MTVCSPSLYPTRQSSADCLSRLNVVSQSRWKLVLVGNPFVLGIRMLRRLPLHKWSDCRLLPSGTEAAGIRGRHSVWSCVQELGLTPSRQAERLWWSDQARLPQEGQDYQEDRSPVGVQRVQAEEAASPEALQALRAWVCDP